MSGAQTAGEADGTTAPPADDPESIASATRLGWKPRDQFGGDPEKWVPAKQFLEVAFERPAVLAENYRRLDARFDRTQRELEGVRGQLTEAVATVSTLTGMVRTSEQRAYDKARRELMAEREKAVETGDKVTFERVDQELETLKKDAPAAPAKVDPTKPEGARTDGTGGGVQEPEPVFREFWSRNPWYGYAGNLSPTVDANLTREADGIFFGLMSTRPDLSTEVKLAETEKRVRQLFPEKFPAPARRTEGDAGGQKNGSGEPSMVTPSGENTGGTRRNTNKFTFDNLPKLSKDAFERYKRQLDGKGAPLTKEEWAHEYFMQDQDYVDQLESQGKL